MIEVSDHDQPARGVQARPTAADQRGVGNCPTQAALDLIAKDKWRLVVLLQLSRRGKMQFGEIGRAIPGIRSKALAQSLRALVNGQLLDRHILPGTPTRVSYALTERARAAVAILGSLQNWFIESAEPVLPQRGGIHTS